MNMEQHRFDILSFIFGALFLGFAASVTWKWNLDLGFDVGDWIFPVAILVIGVALLASGINAAMQRRRPDQ
jgi:tellurite resistance protein TehA-like permease